MDATTHRYITCISDKSGLLSRACGALVPELQRYCLTVPSIGCYLHHQHHDTAEKDTHCAILCVFPCLELYILIIVGISWLVSTLTKKKPKTSNSLIFTSWSFRVLPQDGLVCASSGPVQWRHVVSVVVCRKPESWVCTVLCRARPEEGDVWQQQQHRQQRLLHQQLDPPLPRGEAENQIRKLLSPELSAPGCNLEDGCFPGSWMWNMARLHLQPQSFS